MKIEAFAICYNEEKLLPYYLRHYSKFCDRITIYDNYSTDRSREICEANPIVRVVPYDTGNQIRDDIYLQIKNNCWKNSTADWVIVGDIDELVYYPDIKARLYALDATCIDPELFNMVSDKFPTTPGQIYEEVQHGVPGGAKMNLFRPSEVREVNYDPGCHVCYPEGNILRMYASGIKTLHMKFLSLNYTIERTELSRSRLSAVNKRFGWGVHYSFSREKLASDFNEQMLDAVKVI
jgi:glycosyltransferase involved in cell wall biosynthesis